MKLSFLITALAALPALAGAEILALPFPGLPVAKDDTVVWSPLFQATWDEMNRFTGKPVKTAPNKLMEQLDSFQWEAAKVMPEGSWKTWSGLATPEFRAKANKEAAALTGDKTGPFKATSPLPGSIAAFGILDRTVTFQQEFIRSLRLPLKFTASGKASDVAFFGVRAGEQTGGIRVLSLNQPEKSHAIRISCKEADDTVILFLPPKPLDFSTACLWIRNWAAAPVTEDLDGKWNDPSIHEGDEVRIPYLTLESDAEFAPLLQGSRHFAQGPPLGIVQASQLTRFRLHEKGASVRSEVTLLAEPFGGEQAPPPIPRKFIYDRPFFVFLWRKDAEWPYFGAWIGNTEAMEPFAR